MWQGHPDCLISHARCEPLNGPALLHVVFGELEEDVEGNLRNCGDAYLADDRSAHPPEHTHTHTHMRARTNPCPLQVYDCAALLLFGDKGPVNFGAERAHDWLPRLLQEDCPGLRSIQELRRRQGLQPAPPSVQGPIATRTADSNGGPNAHSTGAEDDGGDDTGGTRDGFWAEGSANGAVAVRCTAKRARPATMMHPRAPMLAGGYKLLAGLHSLSAAPGGGIVPIAGNGAEGHDGGDSGSTDSCISPSACWQSADDLPPSAFPGSLALMDPAPLTMSLPLPPPLLEAAAPAVVTGVQPAAALAAPTVAVAVPRSGMMPADPVAWPGLPAVLALSAESPAAIAPSSNEAKASGANAAAVCTALHACTGASQPSPKMAASGAMPPPPALAMPPASAGTGAPLPQPLLPTPGAAPTPRALLAASVVELAPPPPPGLNGVFGNDFGDLYNAGGQTAVMEMYEWGGTW